MDSTPDLNAALAKAQAQMTAIPFDRTNPHFKSKYASLAAVIDTVRKPLADNGLSYTQTTQIRDGGFVLVTTLRHVTGQCVASEYPLPVVAKPQEMGSALTYARRYSLSALACIAADDDDDAEGARTGGQTASTPSPIKPKPAEAPVNPTTGEVSPHAIAAPHGTQVWASYFAAAIKSARSDAEIDAWIQENTDGLASLAKASAKGHGHITTLVNSTRKSFEQKAA